MKYKVGDKVMLGALTGVITGFPSNGIIKVLWEDGKETKINDHAISPDYRAMYEQEKAIIEQIKAAFSRYVKTEGCSCCQDTIGHKEAEKRLAELLNPEPYEDGSGWKWY